MHDCAVFFCFRYNNLLFTSNVCCFNRTGESRGFAFVRYRDVEEAQKAVDRLDGNMTFTMLKDDYYNTLKMTIAIIKNYDYLLAYL